MVNKNFTRQTWEPGHTVKVGFMTLKIIEAIPTPGDYKPDQYLLENPKNGKRYTFTPHYGLEAV